MRCHNNWKETNLKYNIIVIFLNEFQNDDTNIFIKRETLSPPLSIFSSSSSQNQIITTRVGLNQGGLSDITTTLPQISIGQMGQLRVAGTGCMTTPVTSCTKPTLVRKLIKQEPDIHVQVLYFEKKHSFNLFYQFYKKILLLAMSIPNDVKKKVLSVIRYSPVLCSWSTNTTHLNFFMLILGNVKVRFAPQG